MFPIFEVHSMVLRFQDHNIIMFYKTPRKNLKSIPEGKQMLLKIYINDDGSIMLFDDYKQNVEFDTRHQHDNGCFIAIPHNLRVLL